MSEQLPEQIDPFRLARQKRILIGSLALGGMERLVPLLHSAQGMVQVELEFGFDEMQVCFLQGKVQAGLPLICQRCLQPMVHEARAELALGVVIDKRAADALPMHYEPLIVEAVPVPLRNIIEDELLLSLPIVPLHELAQCPAGEKFRAGASEIPQKQNPFAVLAQIKSRPGSKN